MMDWTLLVDTLGSLAGGLTAIFAFLFGAYMFLRRRVRTWWAPIRAGVDGAAQVPALRNEVASLSGSVRLVHLRMAARANFSDSAECDFDNERRMTVVNATLARRLGVGKKELEGFGYLGFIAESDRESFRALHKQCSDEHRVFDWRGNWNTASGQRVPMHWVLTPIPEPPETPIQMWTGVGEFEE